MNRNLILTLLATMVIVLYLGFALYECRPGFIVDKSANKVYWSTLDEGRGHLKTLVPGADAASFEVMKDIDTHGYKHNSFGRDKDHVYFQDKTIPGADPMTFANLGKEYWKDAKRVYIFDSMLAVIPIPESDSASFEVLGDGWAVDSKRAYYYKTGFIPEDIKTFEIVNRVWAKDKCAYYYTARKAANADLKTFELMNDSCFSFAKDRNHVYWHGWVVPGADPITFKCENGWNGRDDKFKYKFDNNFGEVFYSQELKMKKEPITK